ncbi:MAG: rRNA processing protein RimM [Acidobacteriota bacterium]|jgi:16S rRNA processing protein RimM|nr:rRNA processing protein RimM [Acidobacteriota bacterium]
MSGGDQARETDGGEELVAVARVVKTRGVRGEVAAELLTDFPERFRGLEELIAVTPARERRTLSIEECWLHNGRVVFKFAGFDTPEAARELVGYELTVPEAEAVEPEEGEFFEWQLAGCRVETIGGDDLGVVASILHYGAAPLLVVKDDAGREQLIPLAESICVEIDTERKLIRVDPPEGLLEA